MTRILIQTVFSLFCLVGISAFSFAAEPSDVPPIKVIYFMPSDMQPIPDAPERLGRVMRCVQNFYRAEMKRNGFGPKTFALEWDAPSRLKLYYVTGKRVQADYGRDDSWHIHNEIRIMMKDRYGVDIDKEVNLVFQTMLKWENGKAIELGPYCASGWHLSGLAFVFDDALLDANNLASKEPGGYYGRPCSIGQFNTHYIGGVAHEIGHAFSLPHDAELETDKDVLGYSIMGGGNHSFGNKLRGEGRDAFLTRADALRLSRVRVFAGDLPGATDSVRMELMKLEARESKRNDKDDKSKSFELSGRVTAQPKLIGMIAYNDNSKWGGDYDAKTFVSTVDKKGNFRFDISEVSDDPFQLRLVGVHENGQTSSDRFVYDTKDGRLDLSRINDAMRIKYLRKYYREKNRDKLGEIASKKTVDLKLRRMAAHALKLYEPPRLFNVAELPRDVKTADLTFAEFQEERVGWHGRVYRAQVPEDIFILQGGKFFESGLFAHANSSIKIDLGARWNTLDIGFGRQEKHGGNLVFTIRGDGRELFKSESVKDEKERRKTISVEDIRILELIVESEGGNHDAWSVWTMPLLKRDNEK